ncbi:hypothetical protein [Streptomyces sp. R35]|uniref:Tat pathway signal sequence domain protein n=1 Tax=Streptomyces sp. R35 TaxID=3238630 RepID=A0AB39SE08_9ACTN
MNQREVEAEHVKELLGRAVDTVRAPGSRGSEAVFAQASRVRLRRRAAATGVAAAAVAAGLVLGPGLLSDGQGVRVAGAPTAGDFTTRAGKFEELLPAGTGKISEVSLMRLVKQAPKAPLRKPVGPYDGDYAVHRDGGVGYISVTLATRKEAQAKSGGKGIEDPCKDAPKDGRVGCTSQKLSNGNLLGIWQEGEADAGSYPTWGPTFSAVLKLTDGRVLHVRDTGGFLGKGQLGPLLKTPPLTRDQLHKLILNPKLLP